MQVELFYYKSLFHSIKNALNQIFDNFKIDNIFQHFFMFFGISGPHSTTVMYSRIIFVLYLLKL